MPSVNEHTGARLVSKALTDEGKKNYDLIFGKQVSVERFFQGIMTQREASEFIKDQGKLHPDWEFVINYTENGILVTGKPIQ